MLGIKEIVFLVVILLANIIQCITGFAGTVLAMPFSIMLVGFGVAKPVLNILGIVASIGVVAANPKSLNIKEFVKIIGIMLVGMLGGFAISSRFDMNPNLLYKLLGSVVIAFMLLGVYNTFIKKENSRDKKSTLGEIVGIFIIVLAGIVHGMFVCGGPLLIIYAASRLKDREEFRTTLSASWIVLNSIIMLSDIRSGMFDKNVVIIAVISIVVLFGAIFAGNAIAKKLDNKVFMIITYILMGISGISLLVK